MIQMCSQCGTRWNVRDRQRVWCPRCRGTLLAPSGPTAAPAPGPVPPIGRRPLPAGYRWVALRPGAAPPPRRGRRELGPTPRYHVIPRWGLVEHFDAPADAPPPRPGPSPDTVRMVLGLATAVLGAAAFVHLVRYILLIVNRSVLLNPWVAGAATWGGVAISVIAAFFVVGAVLTLITWLIARRAAAYAHAGQLDPRPAWELRLNSLIPVFQVFWAPVYVLELADVEGRATALRRPVTVWWIVWVLSTCVSVFSLATSFTTDAQGIADNTVATIVAYVVAAGAMVCALRVFQGFERRPVERPAKRWLIAGEPSEDREKPDDAARAVEPAGQNPAA